MVRLKIEIEIENQECLMSAELRQAMEDLKVQLSENNAEIDNLINRPVVVDPDVDQAVADIRNIIAENKAKIEAARAAHPV